MADKVKVLVVGLGNMAPRMPALPSDRAGRRAVDQREARRRTGLICSSVTAICGTGQPVHPMPAGPTGESRCVNRQPRQTSTSLTISS